MADRMRRTFEVSFPRDLSLDQVLAFIRALSGLALPKPWQPAYGVAFELYANEEGKRYFISLPGHVEAEVDNWLSHFIDGASIEAVTEDVVAASDWRAVELGLTSTRRPLDIKNPRDITAGISACFNGFQAGEVGVMQWLVTPSRPYPSTPETKDKLSDKTYNATLRLGAAGAQPEQVLRRIYAGLSVAHTFGVKFKRRLVHDAAGKLRRRAWVPCPVFLNATELAGLLGWPFGEFSARIRARVLAPDNMIDREGIVLGASNFPKLRGRPLALSPTVTNMHGHYIGGTGTGKSNALVHFSLQAIKHGHGLVLIEPTGQLARDVLERIPSERAGDVIFFNSADVERPIGLNLLAGPDPERTTGYIVSLFERLYHDQWGSRLERILRYSVLTAALNNLTLYDVKALLVNKDFRQRIVRQTKDGEARQFWRWLDDSSDTFIDSVINKLDGFLGSRAIRNIVAQTDGLDVPQVVRDGKILLVPLPSSELGEKNAAMIGSMVVAQLWQEVRLGNYADRAPIDLVLDEGQTYLGMAVSVEELLDQARKYKLGVQFAHQRIDQLTSNMRSALAANASTKISFRVDKESATKLVADFAPLTVDDLMSLPQYTIAARIMTEGGLAPTVTGVTAPPPHPTGAGPVALAASQARWGRPVSEVEAELSERHCTSEERRRPSIGRPQ